MKRAVRVEVEDGLALHAVVSEGDGPPVLLVHGLSSNLRLWDGVADRLAELGHCVLAVDLRGHGRSDKPDTGYEVAQVADDLVSVIASMGTPPVVAGQSWGGNVVLELAHRHPGLMAAVALVDGGWIELSERFEGWEACRRALGPPPTEGLAAEAVEALLRRTHPDWPEEGIAGAMACFEHRADGTVAPWLTLDRHLLALRGLWEHRPSGHYGGIEVPVLLVPADTGDAAWTAAKRVEVVAAEEQLPRSRTHWVRGDHDLHAQHPRLVADLFHELAPSPA
ncbi:MAG: alpha/beta hydrolase [Acidimicrobiia bacterium]|nr:alpha/beta hydrolase [Acidimicrobiia bacterium]